jgi:tRNA threonylcarbamoyladenosine biosynthesis protein TsaB
VAILAIETSVQPGSLAVATGWQSILERQLPSGSSTAAILLPEIAELLRTAGHRIEQIDTLAVCQGPGSFTGLRIAITVAKVWSYARGAKVVAITTPEVIAAQVPVEEPELWVLLDAQRRELFAQKFVALPDGWQPEGECHLWTVHQWRSHVNAPCQVAGPGVTRIEMAEVALPPTAAVVPSEQWWPKAATLARLAVRRAEQGQFADPWRLVPHYVRPSGAEERLAPG